jgi:integrase
VHEIERLALAVGKQGGDIVRFLAFTGLRWGELAGLQVRDFDVASKRLRVRRAMVEVGGTFVQTGTKTHRVRAIPLVSILVPILMRKAAGKEPQAFLFSTSTGTPIRNTNFRRSVKWTETTRRIGFEGLRIHDLRHTAASLMIASGATVVDTQAVLGHSNSHTTLTFYAHLFKDRLDDVSLRLDSVIEGAAGNTKSHLRSGQEEGPPNKAPGKRDRPDMAKLWPQPDSDTLS